MSEAISTEKQDNTAAGVVELGSASEQTRGSLFLLPIPDGSAWYPFIFRNV